nr:MAG TPA: hypothetical protein [Caudoviricetes sp.]
MIWIIFFVIHFVFISYRYNYIKTLPLGTQ